ncbi:hypothetical protein V2G26_019255 [Clonostachys chloroleuca]
MNPSTADCKPLLLLLPLELRNEIYRLVIDTVIVPPASPDLNQENRQALQYRNYLSSAILPQPIPENRQGSHTRDAWSRQINPSLSLLQVNKQVNAEVTRFLQHRHTSDYSVDIVYVKGLGLWPTWSIPALPQTPYINSVYTILRMSDEPPALPGHILDESDTSLSWNCRSVLLTYFEGLLSTLFNRGPGFFDRSRSHHEDDPDFAPKYVVNRIIINVISATKALGQNNTLTGDEESQTGHGRRSYWQTDEEKPRSPENRLVTGMTALLERILNPGYQTYLPHIGMMMYEHIIGSFIFMLDGKQVWKIDVEDRLQNWGACRLALEAPNTLPKYQEWKHWVDERRTRMKQGVDLDNTRPANDDIWSRRPDHREEEAD